MNDLFSQTTLRWLTTNSVKMTCEGRSKREWMAVGGDLWANVDFRAGHDSNPHRGNSRVVLPEIPRSQIAKLMVIISAGLSFFLRLEDI